MWKPKKWIPILVVPRIMKIWSIINGFDVGGVTLPGLILLSKHEPVGKTQRMRHQKLVNHECIHIYQQMELLIFGFFALYILNYIINLLRYGKTVSLLCILMGSILTLLLSGIIPLWIPILISSIGTILMLANMNHYKAYMNIVFEKEAYSHDDDFNYLKDRKPFQWLRMIF